MINVQVWKPSEHQTDNQAYGPEKYKYIRGKVIGEMFLNPRYIVSIEPLREWGKKRKKLKIRASTIIISANANSSRDVRVNVLGAPFYINALITKVK